MALWNYIVLFFLFGLLQTHLIFLSLSTIRCIFS